MANLITAPLTSVTGWDIEGTFTPGTTAIIEGPDVAAISSTPVPGHAGAEYTVTADMGAGWIEDGYSEAGVATLQLRIGSTVLAEQSKPAGRDEAGTPFTVKATIPAGYMPDSTNGVHIRAYVEKASQWVSNPTLWFSNPSLTSNHVEPTPEPVPAKIGAAVAAFLGRPGDPITTAQADVHAAIVTEYVRGYTRGKGFLGGNPTDPVHAVIVSATARLTGNPEQVSFYQSGDYSERPAVLAGWTLPELAILNLYRRRAA